MGGAAGHMRHPHDLNRVKSGSDLIDLFYDISAVLEQGLTVPNVKIDGTNVSFKYTGNQFAVDRGSMKEIDLSGVTIDRVEERFPTEGHGMRPALTTLLNILNEALPDIMTEIKALGLVDNRHYFLNTEFVTGKTNAVGYQEDFIAIHGVNAFYEKAGRGGSYRQGDPRPVVFDETKGREIPTKDPSHEVPYDQNAMISLIDKLNQVAPAYGFKVYGPIPTTPSGDLIDLDNALSTIINFNATEYLISVPALSLFKNKTIEECLLAIDKKPGNYPNYPLLLMNDGKKRNPYHKDTYLNILKKNIPLESIAPPETIVDFVKGAIFMHATRLLGRAVLRSLSSELGNMVGDDGGQEGVVIRNPELSPHPFKLTGDFIELGMHGAMAQNESKISIKKGQLKKLIEELVISW